jgi:hypothetical protein
MPNGEHWIQKYGKSPSEMDDGELKMAIMNELYDLAECNQHIKDKITCLPRHEKLFYIITVSAPLLVTFLVWLALQAIS